VFSEDSEFALLCEAPGAEPNLCLGQSVWLASHLLLDPARNALLHAMHDEPCTEENES
jgi:hypothetical protein